MTGITELAQSLKAAAEKATPGRWEYYPGNTSIEYNVDSMDEDQGSIVYVDSGDFTQAQTDRNGEFIALANPASILALVEALEKAQQRIAELESRTVKLPDLRQIVSGDRYVWSDGVYNYSQDVKVALAAAGIKVEQLS
ncbi:ead/Ea22-like family protein [Klebsiella pneumoniae]|uniref:ead/Ea22-like family protein n=1 Tax=Klebsiella pneumoniae TaxID=573 RepID=UPI003CFA41E3